MSDPRPRLPIHFRRPKDIALSDAQRKTITDKTLTEGLTEYRRLRDLENARIRNLEIARLRDLENASKDTR